MKPLAAAIGAVVLALSLNACNLRHPLEGRYNRNAAATGAYLAEKKTAPVKTNFEGIWHSPEWGLVVLNQDAKGNLTGIFQDYYSVKGIVSGRNAYIALIDDEWTEYTVQLTRKNSETVVGQWSSYVPFNPESTHDLTMTKITSH